MLEGAGLRSLVRRAQEGDHEAFEKLVRDLEGVARRYARAILGDVDLADDAVQEAFVQAYLSLPKLNEPAAFPVWLRAIVHHSAHRLIRGKRAVVVPLDEAVGIASDAPSPHEQVEQREMARSVLDAVRALPEAEREVARLFYFEGRSQREIAGLLGLPATTVNNRLHTSRKRLRQLLDPAEGVGRREQRRPAKERRMVLTHSRTTRKLLEGEGQVTIRRMVEADIPAMRRLDGEITASLDFTNAQSPPGRGSTPGGPWSDDAWLREHFLKYERSGNLTLLAEDESGRAVGFADLWTAREPQPFGDSLDVECIDYLWEYHALGLEAVLLEEAEKVARAAGLPALDIGTNTSSGDYPWLRRLGLRIFYEYDRAWTVTVVSAGHLPSYREIPPDQVSTSGLLRVGHWAPSDFDFAHEPGRPRVHEFQVEGRRVVADFWRLWEPGQERPVDCELFAPPEALSSPELMSRILAATAALAGELGAEEIPLPIPVDMAVDPALVAFTRREFAYAWMRKRLE